MAVVDSRFLFLLLLLADSSYHRLMSRTVSFKQGDKPSQVARAVSLSSHNSLSGAVRLSDVHTYCSCTVDPAEEEFVHCLQGWIRQFELARRG